jgi:hypothetical protein
MDIYNFNTAVTEITLALGNRSDINSRVQDWLNSAQLQMAKTDLEMPQLEETVTGFRVVSGQSEYNLLSTPVFSDFNNILGFRFIKNDTTGVPMGRFDWSDYRRLVSQAVSPPVRWTRKGNLFAVDPQPDATYQLRIDLRRRPRQNMIELDGEWQGHLINATIMIGAQRLGLKDTAQMAQWMLPKAVLVLLQTLTDQNDLEMKWSDAQMVSGYGRYGLQATY